MTARTFPLAKWEMFSIQACAYIDWAVQKCSEPLWPLYVSKNQVPGIRSLSCQSLTSSSLRGISVNEPVERVNLERDGQSPGHTSAAIWTSQSNAIHRASVCFTYWRDSAAVESFGSLGCAPQLCCCKSLWRKKSCSNRHFHCQATVSPIILR